jgi:hypothetical protein
MESFAGADLHQGVTQLAVLRDGQAASNSVGGARKQGDTEVRSR